MPEAHLQQARSGMGQAAVGPHPLCRHLMSLTLLFSKGCRWLGGAGSPQGWAAPSANAPAMLCIRRRCVHVSTVGQQSLAPVPAPPVGYGEGWGSSCLP